MLLKEGDVVLLKRGHEVYTDIPRHFIYENHEGDFTPDRHEVKIGVLNFNMGLDTTFMIGKWIVYKTSYDGGSSHLGMNGHTEDYPDGHHVFIKRVVKSKYSYVMEADFYQTGCFTAIIEEDKIKVIGKAEATWKIKTKK